MTDDPGRKIVVIFTDGEDSKSIISVSELKDLVRSSTVTIYPIVFGGKYSDEGAGLRARLLMKELADLTGGEVFNPKTFRDLAPIYDGLLDELATQYVIGYVPSSATWGRANIASAWTWLGPGPRPGTAAATG